MTAEVFHRRNQHVKTMTQDMSFMADYGNNSPGTTTGARKNDTNTSMSHNLFKPVDGVVKSGAPVATASSR